MLFVRLGVLNSEVLDACHQVFLNVLAARKTNLVTARARKTKCTVLVLADAHRSHSILLKIHNGTREQLRMAIIE